MQLFYTETPLSGTCLLDPAESKHLIRVLRFKKGDEVLVTDGTGKLGRGVITKPDINGCMIDIREISEGPDKRNYYLHIAISPLTNSERLDWFIEKAVEIGVDEISLVVSDHSVRKRANTARLRRIAISAMKQSLRTRLTRINEPVNFHDFIRSPLTEYKIITYCGAAEKDYLHLMCSSGEKYTIMIGPEGDFSEPEVEASCNAGFRVASLGTGRLRTETAGIVACHSIYLINL
ncbi:MAG: RsmE family RNA methyltransferase [Bacteroidales bacterium]